MKAKITDVAREAQVSIGTVSRVLNGKMHVRPNVQKRILDAAQKLHYRPNPTAIQLLHKSNHNILCADHFSRDLAYQNPHMYEILAGLSQKLRGRHYGLQFLNLYSKEDDAEKQILDAIFSHSCDGIFLNVLYLTPAIASALIEHDFPHISLGRPVGQKMISWIDTNHALSSNLAVRHLLDTGARSIAFLGGPFDDGIYQERLRGFRRSLEQQGIALPSSYLLCVPPIAGRIADACRQLLDSQPLPDAILCNNGIFALVAMQILEERGLSVPDQISVMCFDNYPYSTLVHPPLSVVDIDMFRLGQSVGEALIKKIENPETYIQTYTALPHLILRASTKEMRQK